MGAVKTNTKPVFHKEPKTAFFMTLVNFFFQTALQLAIIHNADKNIVNYLLSKKASLEVTDTEGNNVIHLAVIYERTNHLYAIVNKNFNMSLLEQFNHEGKYIFYFYVIFKGQICVSWLKNRT